MNSPNEHSSPPTKAERDAGFAAARLANLLDFAKLTPEQKLDWLAQMLDAIRDVRPDFRRVTRD